MCVVTDSQSGELNEFSPGACRTLFIQNLHATSKEKALKKAFTDCGTILVIKKSVEFGVKIILYYIIYD